jgi:hypothetical protein
MGCGKYHMLSQPSPNGTVPYKGKGGVLRSKKEICKVCKARKLGVPNTI